MKAFLSILFILALVLCVNSRHIFLASTKFSRNLLGNHMKR